MASYIHSDDRKIIKDLHNFEEVPTSQRNASNIYSSRVPWSQEPTRIPVPSNDNAPFIASVAKSHERVQSRDPYNPYSRRIQNNLNQPRIATNRSRQTVLTSDPRPAKRPRIDDRVKSSSKKTKFLAPEPAIFDVDNWEDVGEPVAGPSSDTLDVKPSSSKISSTKQRHSLPSMTTTDSRISYVDDESNWLMEQKSGFVNGEDAVWFQREHKPPAPRHSSPIEQFSEPERLLKAGDDGYVKRRAAAINGTPSTSKPVPHIDFNKMSNSLKSIKNSMKARNQKASNRKSLQADSIATSSTSFESSSLQKQAHNYSLPIAQWCLGLKLFTEPYTLRFQPRNEMFVLEAKGHSEIIHFSVVNTFEVITQLSHPSSLDNNGCIKVVPNPIPPDSPYAIGTEYKDFFASGEANGKGTVTIKLDLDHANWSGKCYEAFYKQCSSSMKISHINDKASGVVWEDAKFLTVSAANEEPDVVREDSLNIRPDDLPFDDEAASSAANLFSEPTSPVGTNVPRKSRLLSDQKAKEINENSQPLRRSTRHQEPRTRRSNPSADPDEVILSYPPATTGAVNITNADFNRLQPGEYLNDTLIEFGLRLWHRELQETEPELAKQIHVFNSFFYKKLNKKNLQEGYQSVRRWTSRFDLFEKKFIIVPINENLHWYLAIIYLPENILFPPPEKEIRNTRKNARSTTNVEVKPPEDATESLSVPPAAAASAPAPPVVTEEESHPSRSRSLSSTTNHTSASPDAILEGDDVRDQDPTLTSEADVKETEDALMNFETSCYIEEHSSHDTPKMERSHQSSMLSPASYMEVEVCANENGEVSHIPTVSKQVEVQETPTGSEPMDVDPKRPATSASPLIEPIPPESFYSHPTKSKGKQKAVESTFEVDGGSEGTSPWNSGHPRTHIFTLDSLGTRHPKVINILGRYLRMEAKDKKGNENTSMAEGGPSAVPVQPNYWDCGVYLIHFARTFVRKPEYFCQIAAQRSTRSTEDRQKDWDAEHLEDFRETLRKKVWELSRQWKKDRAAKDQEKKAEKTEQDKDKEKERQPEAEIVPDSSDDEVDIVETTPAAAPVRSRARGRGKEYGSKAKVTRMRG